MMFEEKCQQLFSLVLQLDLTFCLIMSKLVLKPKEPAKHLMPKNLVTSSLKIFHIMKPIQSAKFYIFLYMTQKSTLSTQEELSAI